MEKFVDYIFVLKLNTIWRKDERQSVIEGREMRTIFQLSDWRVTLAYQFDIKSWHHQTVSDFCKGKLSGVIEYWMSYTQLI